MKNFFLVWEAGRFLDVTYTKLNPMGKLLKLYKSWHDLRNIQSNNLADKAAIAIRETECSEFAPFLRQAHSHSADQAKDILAVW